MFRPRKFSYHTILSESGIQFNLTNFVRWNDIESAKISTILGLPYVKIKKKTGILKWLSWWIPLYLGNYKEFLLQVENHAPKDNPFRHTVVGFSGPKVIIPPWVWLTPLFILSSLWFVGNFLELINVLSM